MHAQQPQNSHSVCLRQAHVGHVTMRATFAVAPYRGVWRVTLDGAFYGDYRSKQNALDGLSDKSHALKTAGVVVNVITSIEATQENPR